MPSPEFVVVAVLADLAGDKHRGPQRVAAEGGKRGPPERVSGASPEERAEGVAPGTGNDEGDAAGVLGKSEHRKYLGRPRASRTRVRDSDNCRGGGGKGDNKAEGRRGGGGLSYTTRGFSCLFQFTKVYRGE